MGDLVQIKSTEGRGREKNLYTIKLGGLHVPQGGLLVDSSFVYPMFLDLSSHGSEGHCWREDREERSVERCLVCLSCSVSDSCH